MTCQQFAHFVLGVLLGLMICAIALYGSAGKGE
jgi:hypothetical protein